MDLLAVATLELSTLGCHIRQPRTDSSNFIVCSIEVRAMVNECFYSGWPIVEILCLCLNRYFCCIRADCVPFPDPGPPSTKTTLKILFIDSKFKQDKYQIEGTGTVDNVK